MVGYPIHFMQPPTQLGRCVSGLAGIDYWPRIKHMERGLTVIASATCQPWTTTAYIPLRRKNICVGSLPWLRPPTLNFALAVPTCWYLKMLKFALHPTRILKFAFPPTRNPNASQWNIGCVGSQTQISRVGHVHFMFFCVNFICVS